jgi:hypothetical protein
MLLSVIGGPGGCLGFMETQVYLAHSAAGAKIPAPKCLNRIPTIKEGWWVPIATRGEDHASSGGGGRQSGPGSQIV